MRVPIKHFDRAKPFYSLVMSYITQLFGVKELLVRGLIGPRKVNREEITRAANFPHTDSTSSEYAEEARNKIEQLLGPLELLSEFSRDHITVDPDEIARELVHNHAYLLPYYIRAAASLLVIAHEITKDRSYRDNGPLWHFLRHCRNAATHNGLFHFRAGEPSRPAEWGVLKIDVPLQGTPLFKGGNGKGLISPGDPILLLWDIEQAYPNMTI